MNTWLKLSLILLSATAVLYSMSSNTSEMSPLSEETSANFDEAALKRIRNFVNKAGTTYHNSYTMIAGYIQGQMNSTFKSYWNVAVFKKENYKTHFYFTGLPDDAHKNKRYFLSFNPNDFNFSILILETNSTPFITHNPTIFSSVHLQS